MRKTAYNLYLVFVASWFLHLATRIEALGAIRFDLLLLVGIVTLLILSESEDEVEPGGQPAAFASNSSRTRKLIVTLVVYAVVTLPFVEWPGSVLNAGLPDYVKALVFYFFTAKLITTPDRLRKLMIVFVVAMTFRVIEPLYLHVTTGYWGSYATMSGYERLDRLAGSPFDVINPNGLAFVILTVIPFFHYLGTMTVLGGIAYFATLPLLIWALLLTGSRSGLVGLVAVLVVIWFKSRRKFVFLAVLVLTVAIVAPLLPADLSDRYRSIFDSNTKNAKTSEGRMSGLESDIKVGMRRPFFGHGLGTSLEANAHFSGENMPSHNLYTETFQELGIFGVVLLIWMLVSIISSLRRSLSAFKKINDADVLLLRLTDSVQVWLAMNVLFSFASYGLRSYEWYFAAGLSDVILRFAARVPQTSVSAARQTPVSATLPPHNLRINPKFRPRRFQPGVPV